MRRFISLATVGSIALVSLGCPVVGTARGGARRDLDGGVHDDAGDVEPADDAGVGGDGGPDAGPSPSATRVTFIHTNDFHANLVPHRDLVRDPSAPDGFRIETRGGAARLATLVRQIRQASPNSIAMNIGDTFHGGVEALFTDGEAVYDVIEAIGFDVGVPGNWDFAFGPHVSWMRYRGAGGSPRLFQTQAGDIRQVAFENIAANVTVEADNTATLPRIIANQLGSSLAPEDEQPWLPPTSIRELGGVKVGLIGLTSDIVSRMHPMMALGLQFADGEDEHLAIVEEQARRLRGEGCAIVAVMSELSIHKDFALAERLEPGLVDVFFSAHTHEISEEPLTTASGALVMEAGNDGFVGQLDVDVAADGTILARTWTLHTIDDTIVEDETVAALVTAARSPFVGDDVNIVIEESFMPNPMAGWSLDRSIDTVIGHTSRLLHRRNALESSFNDAFTDMLKAYTGADVALSPGFRYEVPLAPPGMDLGNGVVATGAVTLEEAFRYFPAPYTLGKGTITVGALRDAAESMLAFVFSPDIWQQEGGWVEGMSGLDVTLDLSRPDGEKITAFAPDSGLADPNRALTVAGCRRPLDDGSTLCSYPGFSNVSDIINPATGQPMTPVELFEIGLNQAVLPTERQSIVDTSGAPMWPQSVFVQPLEGVQ